MQAKVSLFKLESDIDWSKDFTWVQDYGRLHPADDSAPGKGQRAYRRGDGTTVVLTDEERNDLYHSASDDGGYTPRYRPAQAHCLAGAVEISLNGERMSLQAGDAVLKYPSGEFEIVHADLYRKNYQAVAFERSMEAPAYPFPFEATWPAW